MRKYNIGDIAIVIEEPCELRINHFMQLVVIRNIEFDTLDGSYWAEVEGNDFIASYPVASLRIIG